MKNIIIIGAGGLGREIACLIEDINENKKQWNLLGFVDDSPELQGDIIGDYTVIGNTDNLFGKELNIVIGISNPHIRKEIYKKLEKTKNFFPTLVHPSVLKSKSVTLGKGVIIAAGSILTVDIEIEDFVILDRNSNIGHDTRISSFSTLHPSITLSGNVSIEENVVIGTASSVIQELKLGKNSIIGAGAVVINNIPANCTAVGVPAKPIKFEEQYDIEVE